MGHEKRDTHVARTMSDLADDGVPDSIDLWPSIRARLDKRRTRRRRTAQLAMLPLVAILISLALVVWPWGGGALPPSAAVVQAYERLISVKSVHVEIEMRMGLAGGYFMYYPPFSSPAPEAARGNPELLRQYGEAMQKKIDEETERANIKVDGTVTSWDVIEKATGQKVGLVVVSGGTTLIEGDFLPPDIYYAKRTDILDVKSFPPGYLRDRQPDETVVTGNTLYSKVNGIWSQFPDVEFGPWFWGLFDEPSGAGEILRSAFESVTRLEDTDLNSVPVIHYKVTGTRASLHADEMEVWVAQDSGYPLKITTLTYAGTESEVKETYLFTKFNEPVEIPIPDVAE